MANILPSHHEALPITLHNNRRRMPLGFGQAPPGTLQEFRKEFVDIPRAICMTSPHALPRQSPSIAFRIWLNPTRTLQTSPRTLPGTCRSLSSDWQSFPQESPSQSPKNGPRIWTRFLRHLARLPAGPQASRSRESVRFDQELLRTLQTSPKNSPRNLPRFSRQCA